MGCFGWLKADNLTQIANISDGYPYKLLIPKEFGGGFIKDHYQGYGRIGTKEDGSPKYDMYELLAFWNKERFSNFPDNGNMIEYEGLRYDGEFPQMKEIDEYTRHNRCLGINISSSNEKTDMLKYPLKLVSVSYKGTYEDLESKSYDDPDQGFYKVKRK